MFYKTLHTIYVFSCSHKLPKNIKLKINKQKSKINLYQKLLKGGT